MIQITPQMRILVAIEAVDGRKGIDSLAQLCQEKLQADPFSGVCLCFAAGVERRSASWFMTGKGSGWRRSGYRKGGLCGGQAETSPRGCCRPIRRRCCWPPATRMR